MPQVMSDEPWLCCSVSQTTTEVDVDIINLLELMQQHRPWEELQFKVKCIKCRNVPIAFCFQCDDCPNCWICSSCMPTEVTLHHDHSLIRVQYRPLSAPTIDGSELALLKRFRTVTTEEDFYLYFPFLFSDFGGFREVRDVNIAKILAMLDSSPNWNPETIKQTREMLEQSSVDSFTRTFGRGDFRPIFADIKPMLQDRIHKAQISSQLFGLYKRHQELVEIFKTKYNGGDIPHQKDPRIQVFVDLLSGQGTNPYAPFVLYSLGLDITAFNTQVNLDGLIPVLQNTQTDSRRKSLPPYMHRVFDIFTNICQDSIGYSQLACHVFGNMMEMDIYVIKRSRLNFLKRSQKIRQLCKYAFKSDIPLTPCVALERISTSSYDEPSLLACRRQRRLGNFLGALYVLEKLDPTDPAVAFEKLLTLFDQGYLQKSRDTCVSVMEIEVKTLDASALSPATEPGGRTYENPVARCLLKFAYNYLGCSTHGQWETALEHAKEVYDMYLSGWKTLDDPQSSSFLIYLEIFYHRTFLEAHRDLALVPDNHMAVRRLQALREYLLVLGRVPEAYDVLVTELELSKCGIRQQYLEHDGALTVRGYVHKPQIALPIVESFLQFPLFHVQGRRYVEEGYVQLLAAELLRESGEEYSDHVDKAEGIFKSCDCSAGLLDIIYFQITKEAPADFAAANALYQSLKSRDDLSRMRRVRRLGVKVTSSHNNEAMRWQETQRDALADLAHQAGDAYSYGIWKLRKYANDFMAAAVIDINEKVFDTASEVQGELLATIATYNLSRAYLIQGNTMEAAANAILHFQLTNKQADEEQQQRAILNVLDCLEQEFNKKPLGRQADILSELEKSWTGILEDSAVARWAAGHLRCDEIDRFICGALFLPNLVGKFASGNGGRPSVLKPSLASEVISHLHVAFALFEALPTYFSSLVLPKLSSALASAAIYCGNNELAVLSYSEGLRSCHSGDHPTINSLRVSIGQRLTYMALEYPEQWLHVLATGRSFLAAAEKFYSGAFWLSRSIELGSQASKILAESYVTEARNRKLLWDKGRESTPLVEAVELIYPLAKASIDRALTMIRTLRQHLIVLTPLEALRNMRFLSSSALTQRLYDLRTELILILESILPLDARAATTGRRLWNTLQDRKAASLNETLGIYATPGYLLAEIQRNPQALALYNKEQELIQQIRHAKGTMGLYNTQRELVHHQFSIMNTNPLLKALIEKRLCLGAQLSDLDCMGVLAKPHFSPKHSLVFLDWLRYHDFFIILGYNATSKSFLYEMITAFKVRDANEWVEENIRNPQVEDPPSMPLSYNPPLAKLLPLVNPIHKFVKPGDILIFSPTGILNSIPLHAIPFENEHDYPVIYHNPVVYCPSNSVMRDCVDRADRLCASSAPWKAAFYGDLRMAAIHPTEDANVRQSVEALANRFGDGVAVAVTGLKLNRNTFQEHLSGSNVVHFHGHATGEKINRGLAMEPLEMKDARNNAYYQQLWVESGFILKDSGIFTVRDVFLTNLNAPLVTLMACSSSEQDVGQSDDPIGLISAFLSAGASSVIGTLWPTDSSDARAFSDVFYQEAFLANPAPISNLALAIQKAVLKLRADQDQEHPRSPYHWAQFVLHGSWFVKGTVKRKTSWEGVSFRELLRKCGVQGTFGELQARLLRMD